MESIVVHRIVIDGGLLCLALGIMVMGSLIYNPRLWLQDYPQVIRDKVPPMTQQEKKQQRLLMLPFLLVMFGVPFVSLSLLKSASGGTISFGVAYLTVVGMLQLFNLFDAVVLDYLILTLMKPRFMFLPGTTLQDYLPDDLKLQARNFLKGIVICSVISLPIAFVGSLIV